MTCFLRPKNIKTTDREPMEKGASFQERILERGGQNLLLIVICFFLVGLAVPLLLVFLIKSPEPGQHIHILGISYYKLVFIFFLSAAIMVHTSLFFLRANLFTIVVVFILSLFCCFPLIVGLRNNLTLHKAIIDTPFFANWPFFLKPAYVMIEFLIPAGILIYLFLQLKSFFSKKPHTYAFFCAALYLSIAASLGFSALIQAKEPNIVTVLARKKGEPVQEDLAALFQETSPHDFSSGNDDTQPRLPIPQFSDHPETGSPVSNARLNTTMENPLPDKETMNELEQKVLLLSTKADHIIVELGHVKDLFTERQKHLQDKKSGAVVQEKGGHEADAPVVAPSPTNAMAINELQKEVRLLSDKVDNILDALGRMAILLPDPQGHLQKYEAVAEEKEQLPQGRP